MNEIRREFKGNIGVFLVCAEISKLNLIALPTSRNTKGYDILLMNPDTNKSAGLQVKCSDKRDYPVLSSHLGDYDSAIEAKILCDFVFVDIAALDKPGYFIVSDKELRDLLKSLVGRQVERYCRNHQTTLEQVVQKETAGNPKPNLWALKLAEIEAFRNKWQTLTDRLQ